MQAWEIENRNSVAKFLGKCRHCKGDIKPGENISLQHIEYQGISNLQNIRVQNFYVHSNCIIER